MKKTITRKLICEQLDKVLKGELSIHEFGYEVLDYLGFVGDKYEYEAGYERLIEKVLEEFMDLHDVGKEGLSYIPHAPSREEMYRIKQLLAE